MKLAPHLPIKYGPVDDNGDSPPPVPAEHLVDGGTFLPSSDGRLWLFHRQWEPAVEKTRATLMIVHGTVDHSGVYREMGRRLADRGIAVFAMDQRGWGLSDGESMYVDDMDNFVADVDALYQHIHTQERYATVKPRFLLGKSLGGLVTAFAALSHPSHWTGLIGLSAAYDWNPKMGNPSFLAKSVLGLLGHVSPKLPVRPLFKDTLLVKDADALQRFRDDELCCKDNLRVGYILGLIHNVTELTQNKQNQSFNLAMLMLCGEQDEIVTMSGHELMLERNQNPDKTLKTYAQGLHNMLQEPTLKDQVMADIEEWILSRSS